MMNLCVLIIGKSIPPGGVDDRMIRYRIRVMFQAGEFVLSLSLYK